MRKQKLLIVGIMLILSLTVACESGSQEFASPDGLVQLINDADAEYLLLDVRTPEEYRQGHIPTAVNIDYRQLESSAARLPEDKTLPVIVYCRSGNRSGTADRTLQGMGYTNIHDFGGISSWPGEIITGSSPQ